MNKKLQKKELNPEYQDFLKYYFKKGSNWNNWTCEDVKQSIAENLKVSREKLDNAELDFDILKQAHEASEAWLEWRDHELH